MAKLTLNVDREVIRKAKAFAESQGTSLSKLISGFLVGLGSGPKDSFFEKLHEELLKEGYKPPSHTDVEKLRRAHVERKYL